MAIVPVGFFITTTVILRFYPLNLDLSIDIMRNSVFVSYVGVKTYYE
ncbi:hypothetical protein [Metabacillus endolithicus]